MCNTINSTCSFYQIDSLCHDINPGHGEVMECLKENYKKIDNPKCRAVSSIIKFVCITMSQWQIFHTFVHVVFCIFSLLIQEIKEALIEERTDIMADPVLHEACQRSVTKHCDDISHGRGRSRFSVF